MNNGVVAGTGTGGGVVREISERPGSEVRPGPVEAGQDVRGDVDRWV